MVAEPMNTILESPTVRSALELVIGSFAIFRVVLFFHRKRNIWILIALSGIATLLMTDIPFALTRHPLGSRSGSILLTAVLGALIFQPEIGWLVRRERWQRPDRKFLEKNGPLDEIVRACRTLSESKTGALIAIQRKDHLHPYIKKSVCIDALIRHELLLTVFTPPTYLHDGAVIVSRDRIISCSAIFPLSQNTQLAADLGTRHRAALGLSEQTDALCVVVSEETGLVSLADRGKLFYNVPAKELRPIIAKLMRFKNVSLPGGR